jgi:SPP1 family predicted phage head-tail adaptor
MSMNEDLGPLDRRVTIERSIAIPDGLGGEEASWGRHADVWASYYPISDSERLRAAEVAATITARFRIRWGLDVGPTDRLVFDGRIYEIVGVKEIGRHKGQEITAGSRAEAI